MTTTATDQTTTPATVGDPRAPEDASPGAGPVPGQPAATEAELLVESELLVEEISIDGMCGVY